VDVAFFHFQNHAFQCVLFRHFVDSVVHGVDDVLGVWKLLSGDGEHHHDFTGALAGFHRNFPEFCGVALLLRLLIPAPAVPLRLFVDGDFVLFNEVADGIGHRHHRFFLKHAVIDVHYPAAASFPEADRRAGRTVVYGKSGFVPIMQVRFFSGNHNIPNQRMFQSADSGEFVFHVFFFHGELRFVLHALEGAATAAAEVRTYRFFPVRRRGENFLQFRHRIPLLILYDFAPNGVSRNASVHEHRQSVDMADAFSVIRHIRNGEFHHCTLIHCFSPLYINLVIRSSVPANPPEL